MNCSLQSYANFIIQIMARSCAPVRDEEVARLNDITDVVDTFRGILETMTLMKLDMANCLLEAARKDVIAHSVEYEKQKFKEFITVYTRKLIHTSQMSVSVTSWSFHHFRWISGDRKLVESSSTRRHERSKLDGLDYH